MIRISFSFLFFILALCTQAQQIPAQLVFPDSVGWNTLNEGQPIHFRVRTTSSGPSYFSIETGEGVKIQFDSLGNFFWKPSFDLVDRVEKVKEFTVIFQATFKNGNRIRKPVTFTITHVNRPPVVEELPIFYVKQSALNNFQLPSEYVYDPDGDPIVIKAISNEMPEGAVLSSLGQFSWTPSRTQFYALRSNPIVVEFIVQDQPDKLETKGKLRVQQTQQDLPPELTIVPSDSVFKIKEDETLNLILYASDPNGDDNVRAVGIIANDKRVPQTSLKENTKLQYEFTWMPGYDFVDELNKTEDIVVTFFVMDKSNNRGQRRIRISIKDTENLIEKDKHQFQKYRGNLVSAYMLIRQLDENQKKLNQDYKKAKQGKKHRSIVNASLGATTGIAPVAINDSKQSKVVTGVGGTTILTMGTLEATQVIGKSKDDIMDRIKIGIDIRNKVQSAGDEFARKYSLKSKRREPEFEKDIDKLRLAMNDQKLVLLELDAYSRNANASRISDKQLKDVFLDYSEEQ